MTKNDIEQAIFGASDGMTSALGVIIPLALTGKSMTIVVLGLAICAAVGMGGGLYLSDSKGSVHSALMMAAATALGTITPALPFMLMGDGLVARLISGLFIIGIAQLIVCEKKKVVSIRKAYLETYGIILTASITTVLFALLTGSAG